MSTSSTPGFVDHFGGVGANYAQFRPTYPQELYDHVCGTEGPAEKKLAIDVGAGTGQATLPLTRYFEKVIGFDPSEGQIKNAEVKADNLEFRLSPAEKIDLPAHSVDLITTAQAAHWFDLQKFYAECARLLKTDGKLAIWGYGTLTIDEPAANDIFQDYYSNTLGDKYWPPERKMIDNHYRDIDPSAGGHFKSENVKRTSFEMSKELSMDHFMGYMTTFSGLKQYKEATKTDPLPTLRARLQQTPLATRSLFKITFPIFLIVARKV